jgi:glycyl-tRNA synthetase (class II)
MPMRLILSSISLWIKELEGIHSRTDFDLKAHEQFSGRKLQYFDELNTNYVPYVVETSVGLDRMFLAFLLPFKRRNIRRWFYKNSAEITFSSGSN